MAITAPTTAPTALTADDAPDANGFNGAGVDEFNDADGKMGSTMGNVTGENGESGTGVNVDPDVTTTALVDPDVTITALTADDAPMRTASRRAWFAGRGRAAAVAGARIARVFFGGEGGSGGLQLLIYIPFLNVEEMMR